VLLLVAALTYSALARNSVDRQWVAHTYLVLETLSDLQSQIANAETGERGFLLTDDSAFSTRMCEHTEIPNILANVRQLTADNHTQQRNLDPHESHITARLTFITHVIDIRHRNGFAAAQAAVSNGSGRLQVGAICTEIATMKAEEDRLLIIRDAGVDFTNRRGKLLIISSARPSASASCCSPAQSCRPSLMISSLFPGSAPRPNRCGPFGATSCSIAR
jgi:CHASE3 domain sensor protein